MMSEGNMSTIILVIDGVVKEDAGTLTFVANNETGHAAVQAILEVEGRHHQFFLHCYCIYK